MLGCCEGTRTTAAEPRLNRSTITRITVFIKVSFITTFKTIAVRRMNHRQQVEAVNLTCPRGEMMPPMGKHLTIISPRGIMRSWVRQI